MNDWLDYKGSKSSRYYANDIMMHSFFGIPSKKEKEAAEARQREADIRLSSAKSEQRAKLRSEEKKAKDAYEEAIDNYNQAGKTYSEASERLREYESDRKKVAETSPLKASEMYSTRIKKAQDDVARAKKQQAYWADEMRSRKTAWQSALKRYEDGQAYFK